MSGIVEDMEPTENGTALEVAGDKPEPAPSERAHVNQILKTIRSDRTFHDPAFKRMRKSMFMAFNGYDGDVWDDTKYTANFAGRHVKQKTDALYAKNPKATATRKKRLDFTIWDENPTSLQMAFQITAEAQVAIQQAQAVSAQNIDPITGMAVPVDPVLPPGFEQAQALIADFQQGTAYQQMVDKIGKTLEILFENALRDQEPLDFKAAAKALVRRACTCGVGYVELGFVREYGPRPDIDSQLADAKVRLDHLRRLTQDALAGEIDQDAAEIDELEKATLALVNEPEIVLREGLIFDFPQATRVIPDQLTRQLVGFVGAQHLTIEYLFTCDQVREMFPDADLQKGGYRGYSTDGKSLEGPSQASLNFDDEDADAPRDANDKGLVCVWKYYDKPSGLVYYVADGHANFLRPPAPPDVFVEKFWPVFALTFNAVESETQLFPKSDVELLWNQQMEHNRSRQGMREHRQAARPRWVTSKGLIDDEFKASLKTANAFDVLEANKDPQTKIEQMLEVMPVPGVDPNLYEPGPYFSDMEITVGTQEAQMGAVSKATATETAIAANSSLASDSSSKDDLDSFLSQVARAGSQILFREMSEQKVKEIVGPGALWPQQTLAQIANEVYLEVEAGSTGRPNQAVEIENFTKIAPLLIQIPDIDSVALAKEGVRRLDDKLDVNKFIKVGAPSIVTQNQQTQPGTGDPSTDPNAQGGAGANNAPTQPEQESPGSTAPFGSNQVERPAV